VGAVASGVVVAAGALVAGALVSAAGVLSCAVTMLPAATKATKLMIANLSFIFLGGCF
jgi:hypothetical protein